jgi:hypothetical protein
LKAIHGFASVDFTFYKSISFSQIEVILAFLMVFFLGLFLKYKTPKQAFMLFGAIVLFFVIRVSLNLIEDFINETAVFQAKKEKVLMIRHGRSANFYVSKPDSNLGKFLIEPYVANSRISDYQINVIPKGTKAVVFNGRYYPLNEE